MHEKDKEQVLQQNEMLGLYCTALGLISKNIILNKITTGRYLKNLILQKVV